MRSGSRSGIPLWSGPPDIPPSRAGRACAELRRALEQEAARVPWILVTPPGPSLRRPRLVPREGIVAVPIPHGACAMRPADPGASCEACLPDVFEVWVDAREGPAEYVGPVRFRFRRLVQGPRGRIAEYFRYGWASGDPG